MSDPELRVVAVVTALAVVISTAGAGAMAAPLESTDPKTGFDTRKTASASTLHPESTNTSVSTTNTDPNPRTIERDLPDSVTLGESFTVRVKARNYGGGPAGSYSSISVSSPTLSDDGDSSQVSVRQSTFAGTVTKSPGESLYDAKGNQISADYPLVEGYTTADGAWTTNDYRTLEVQFTPDSTGQFVVYIRTTMQDDDSGQSFTDPGTGDATDQQGFEVYRHVVSVKAPSGSISGQVTDTSGSPLEGSVVYLDDGTEQARTDSSGYYTFDSVDEGDHTVRVAAGGCYPDREHTVSVRGGEQTTQNFELPSEDYQITLDSDPVSTSLDGAGTYDCGSDVVISAPASVGEYDFVEWRTRSGELRSTQSSFTSSVVTDLSFVAHYRRPGKPDLTVERIDVVPSSPPVGTPATLNVTVANNGEARAADVGVETSISSGEIFYSRVNLDPGTSETLSFEWTPEGDSATVEADIDYEDRIDEEDDTNNRRSRTVEIGQSLSASNVQVRVTSVNGKPFSGDAIENPGGNIRSVTIELVRPGGEPVIGTSPEITSAMITDLVGFDRERVEPGVFNFSLTPEVGDETYYQRYNVSATVDGTRIQRQVTIPVDNTADPLSEPVEGWATSSDPITVLVDGERYTAVPMARHVNNSGAYSFTGIRAWAIFDSGGELVTDPTTVRRAAQTATVSTLTRKGTNDELERLLSDEYPSELRFMLTVDDLYQLAKTVRDASALVLGTIVGGYLSGGSSVAGHATKKLSAKQAAKFAAKELAKEILTRMRDADVDSQAFLTDPMGTYERMKRRAAKSEIRASARQAELAGQIASNHPDGEPWSYEDSARFWRAYNESMTDGLLWGETRVQSLPDGDERLESQLESIGTNFVEGATGAPVTTLNSYRQFFDLITSGELGGGISAAVQKTSETRQTLQSQYRNFHDRSVTVTQRIDDAGAESMSPTDPSATSDSATVQLVSMPSGTYVSGDRVRTTVRVENTGETTSRFFVGYSVGVDSADGVTYYDNRGQTGRHVTLGPGSARDVELEWTVPDRVPKGSDYDVVVAVWDEYPSPDAVRYDSLRRKDQFRVVRQGEVRLVDVEVPTTVEQGEVTLEATVESTRPAPVRTTLSSRIDGDLYDQSSIYVPSGETKTTTFSLVLTGTGERTITVELGNDGEPRSRTVSVEASGQDPVADPGGSYSTTADEPVVLDAADSVDPDGTITDTNWQVVSGPGSMSGSTYSVGDSLDERAVATVLLTVTDDDGNTGSALTDVTVTPAEAGATAAQISPADLSVPPGDTTRYEILVDATGGIGSYQFDLSVTDPTVARIESVDLTGIPDSSAIDISPDNGSVEVTVSGADTVDSGLVRVAAVSIVATQAGTTGVNLSMTDVANENGLPYTITSVSDGTLGVDSRREDDPSASLSADFENGTLGDWTVIDPHKRCDGNKNDWQVTDSSPIAGSNSLHVDTEGAYNAIASSDAVVDMSEDFDLTYYWRTPDPSNRGPHTTTFASLEGLRECTPEVHNQRGRESALGIWYDADAISSSGSPYTGTVKLIGATGSEVGRQSLAVNTVHEVRIEKRGDRATLYIDGREKTTTAVRTNGTYHLAFQTSGTWGGASSMTFDNVSVRPIASGNGTPEAGSDPTAAAGPDRTVDAGTTVELNATGSSDPDGDQLSYLWTQTAGPTVTLTGARTATPTFTAPAVANETTLTFETAVRDASTRSDTDAVTITVRPDGGDDGGSSAVTFRDSFETPDTGYDPSEWSVRSHDGGTLTQTGEGGLRVSSATYSYHGIESDRAFGPGSRLEFTVDEWANRYGSAIHIGFVNSTNYLTNGRAANPRKQAHDSVSTTFQLANDRSSPRVQLHTQRDSIGEDEGDHKTNLTVTRHTSLGWDGDGTNTVAVEWRSDNVTLLVNGRVVASHTTHIPTQPMPVYVLGHEYTGSKTSEMTLANLSVNDSDGGDAAGPANEPPVADASAASTLVPAGTTLSLDATDSTDPDGDSLSYEWSQTGGATVTLTDATTASPTVTAPSVSTETTLVFEVTVRDGAGGVDTDTVSISVEPPATPPRPTNGTDTVVVGYDASGVGLDTYDIEVTTPGTNATIVDYEAGIQKLQPLNESIGTGSIRARSFLPGAVTGSVPLYEVTFDRPVERSDLAVTVYNVSGEGRQPVSSDRVELWTSASPFPQSLPGGTTDAPPTDPDGDGKLEDLTGDGRFTFADVIEFVFALGELTSGSLTDRQRAALDHDRDSAIGFADVIDLVFQLGG